MVFEWIFKKRAEKDLDLLDPSFVNISSLPVVPEYPHEYMFTYDDESQCVIKSDVSHSINLSFTKLYYITAYKLQILPTKRYMTGWRIDTSIDGTNFFQLDIRNENLCFSDYIHLDIDGNTIIDCQNLTTREFATQKTRFKYLNLVMTEKDSCKYAYQFQSSLFDLFLSPVTDFSSESICLIQSLFFYISLLFS